jgi:hypothetical protein
LAGQKQLMQYGFLRPVESKQIGLNRPDKTADSALSNVQVSLGRFFFQAH